MVNNYKQSQKTNGKLGKNFNSYNRLRAKFSNILKGFKEVTRKGKTQ